MRCYVPFIKHQRWLNLADDCVLITREPNHLLQCHLTSFLDYYSYVICSKEPPKDHLPLMYLHWFTEDSLWCWFMYRFVYIQLNYRRRKIIGMTDVKSMHIESNFTAEICAWRLHFGRCYDRYFVPETSTAHHYSTILHHLFCLSLVFAWVWCLLIFLPAAEQPPPRAAVHRACCAAHEQPPAPRSSLRPGPRPHPNPKPKPRPWSYSWPRPASTRELGEHWGGHPCPNLHPSARPAQGVTSPSPLLCLEPPSSCSPSSSSGRQSSSSGHSLSLWPPGQGRAETGLPVPLFRPPLRVSPPSACCSAVCLGEVLYPGLGLPALLTGACWWLQRGGSGFSCNKQNKKEKKKYPGLTMLMRLSTRRKGVHSMLMFWTVQIPQ